MKYFSAKIFLKIAPTFPGPSTGGQRPTHDPAKRSSPDSTGSALAAAGKEVSPGFGLGYFQQRR
jgi:hypothetical protein